jgi:hypothetical protein
MNRFHVQFVVCPPGFHEVIHNSIEAGLICYDYKSARSLAYFWRLYSWLIFCFISSDLRLNTSESNAIVFGAPHWNMCNSTYDLLRVFKVGAFICFSIQFLSNSTLWQYMCSQRNQEKYIEFWYGLRLPKQICYRFYN